jgi:hypothetical protein
MFEKYPNIKFHENPSSGNRVVPCGRTDIQTDKKVIVAFRSFARAPKIRNTSTSLQTQPVLILR